MEAPTQNSPGDAGLAKSVSPEEDITSSDIGGAEKKKKIYSFMEFYGAHTHTLSLSLSLCDHTSQRLGFSCAWFVEQSSSVDFSV
ncbi:hypothetical protein LWI29_014850 [Acer saccharum]|uniref:Uncharacterized protein n=1 Tax=Acer saccharum TaxID=4024 RepID=A0AA39TRM5_ACESA|nr:hypothetical protein LWI29_014850 [Acer saccharum]